LRQRQLPRHPGVPAPPGRLTKPPSFPRKRESRRATRHSRARGNPAASHGSPHTRGWRRRAWTRMTGRASAGTIGVRPRRLRALPFPVPHSLFPIPASLFHPRFSPPRANLPPLSVPEDNGPMLRQRTLKNVIRATGVGLHSGNKVFLTLRPAPPDTGILFRRI